MVVPPAALLKDGVLVTSDLLPTPGMGGYRLEEFLGDLLKRMERVHGADPRLVTSSRNGSSGQKQDGVDHRGEYSDGTRIFLQCKEQKSLTKTHITKIVKDVAEAGETAQRRVIVFSRIASSTARAEITKHPGWEIWDQADLGDRVRSLLVQDARMLLDTHFGRTFRRKFLPVAGTDAFLPLEAYFAPLLDKQDRFHHHVPLMGREADLSAIVTALTEPAGPKVIVVEGPAGRGKSRLVLEALRQAGEALKPVPILVRVEGHVLDSGALDELPVGPAVLLAEDAHRNLPELAALLQYAQRTDGVRVLLTLRSFARAAAEQATVAAQVSLTELMVHSLAPLTATAARDLVAELQGDGLTLTPAFAEHLAQAARATPFVAVVATAMIRRGELSTALTLDKNLQQEVMSRYGQVVTEGIPDATAQQVRKTLALIAAVSPVRLDDGPLMDAITKFLAMNRADFLALIQTLTQHGALLERDRTIRVVPDLLADEVLAGEAVVMGMDSGLVGQIWQAFPDQHSVLLPNLAALDWRLRQAAALNGNAAPADVFSGIWTDFRARFLASDHGQRCANLDAMDFTAATQGGKVLALLQEAVTHPGQDGPDGAWPFSHDDVRHRCARLIGICLESDANLLGAGFDQLWQLARDDGREPHQVSDHPVRVMERLASLGADSALRTAGILVDRVAVWLAQTDEPGSARTPLFALEPLLTKAGNSTEWRLNAIGFRPFIVAPASVRLLRERIRQLLAPIIEGSDVRRAVDAVRLLDLALDEPRPQFGQELPPESVLAWEDDDLLSVATLTGAAKATREPLVRCEIRTAVAWPAELAASTVLREACRVLIADLDAHDEDLLTELLAVADYDRMGITEDPDSVPAQPTDAGSNAPETPAAPKTAIDHYEQTVSRRQEQRSQVATQLWEASTTPKEVVDHLIERLTVIAIVQTEPAPGLEDVLRAVVDARPEATADLLQAVMEAPESPLDYSIAVVLDALLKRDQDGFLPTLQATVASRSSLAIGALHGFSSHQWATVAADAAPIITAATTHPDPAVSQKALASTGVLLRANPIGVTPRLLQAAPTHPYAVAAAVADAAGTDAAAWTAAMNDDERRAVLAILAVVPKPNVRHRLLLNAIASVLPADAVEVLAAQAETGSFHLRPGWGLDRAFNDHPAVLVAWIQRAAPATGIKRFW